jgi:FkbM family methyltransferase
MMRTAQNYLHRKLLERGWLIRRAERTGGWETSRAYWDPAYLKPLNFHPATVVDVGVGLGTAPLYEAFPKAYLVMVEPLSEFNIAIQSILADRCGVHVPMALGAAQCRRTKFVEPRHILGSSFYERCEAERTGDMRTAREVEGTTLDAMVEALRFPAPYGLKLDTEGAEIEILGNATKCLRDTLFVIAEVSVMNRFEDGFF